MMIVKKFLAVLVCMCSLAGSANAGLMLTGNDPAHIALGSGFGAVGWVNVDRGSGVTGVGAFSLIDDGRWGLTSKHILLSNESNSSSFFSNIRVGFGNYQTNPLQTTSAFDIYVNPNNDSALFHFQNAFNGIDPLQRFRGDVVNGMEGFTVGYGLRQYVNDAVTGFTGDKRAGFDVVSGVNPFETNNFRTVFDVSNRPGFRPLEMGIRPGDSGGGWILANLGLSTNQIAGINDSSTLTDGFGSASYYNRLPNVWIDNIQATAVPEPASIILFSTGIGIVIRRRARKTVIG